MIALAMVMGLCLLVYALGQRALRKALAQATEATMIRHQTGKQTARPTLRGVFQPFRAVYPLRITGGAKRTSDLSEERRKKLSSRRSAFNMLHRIVLEVRPRPGTCPRRRRRSERNISSCRHTKMRENASNAGILQRLRIRFCSYRGRVPVPPKGPLQPNPHPAPTPTNARLRPAATGLRSSAHFMRRSVGAASAS